MRAAHDGLSEQGDNRFTVDASIEALSQPELASALKVGRSSVQVALLDALAFHTSYSGGSRSVNSGSTFQPRLLPISPDLQKSVKVYCATPARFAISSCE